MSNTRSSSPQKPEMSNPKPEPVPEPPQPSRLPESVLRMIRGEVSAPEKAAQYQDSLGNWWKEYADRKNDEKDEYIANTLLYDRNHLPRIAPPPDHAEVKKEEAARRVLRAAEGEGEGEATS